MAKQLGNTPTICRKCYVHPEVLAAYLEGDCIAVESTETQITMGLEGLRSEEDRLLAFLDRRLKNAR